MTSRLAILCVEDEPSVRDAMVRDLAVFSPTVVVQTAESVEDARAALTELTTAGDHVALVLADHLLPGDTGVDFLVELHRDPTLADARKVLVTGQAGLDDTIRAVNRADLDHYIGKPWSAEQLRSVVRHLLTDFVAEHLEDVLPYVAVLDGSRLLAEHARRAGDR